MSNTYRHKIKGKINHSHQKLVDGEIDSDTHASKIRSLLNELGATGDSLYIGFYKAFGKAHPGTIKREAVRLNRQQRQEVKHSLRDADRQEEEVPKSFSGRRDAYRRTT